MQTSGLVLGFAVLTATAAGADFYPLQSGNTWTYRNAVSGESFTVAVGPPVTKNGRTYYSLSGYLAQPALVRLNGRGDLVGIDDQTGEEQTLTRFGALERMWWNAPGRACQEQGKRSGSGVHDGPAGPFNDALQIVYRTVSCADMGTELEQCRQHRDGS